MNTFIDLDFVIPAEVTKPSDIPKTFIYSDNISEGIAIQTHLISKLPTELQVVNIVRPYNATFSSEYRQEVMKMFKD